MDTDRAAVAPQETTSSDGAPRAGRYSLRVLAWATIGVLVGLLLTTAIAASVARMLNQQAQRDLEQRWVTAQVAVGQLTAGYLDQEAAERGYLLTGEQAYLEPYRVGVARTARLQARLRELLAPDPAGTRTLAAVAADGSRWRTTAAQPAIAARARGLLAPVQLNVFLPVGKELFDRLRARLQTLERLTVDLVHDDLGSIAVRQTASTVIAATAVGLSILLAAISVPLVRRALLRPLDWLVHQLQAVAGGAEDRPITPVGPTELQTIAAGAEQMRQGLVERARQLLTTQRKLTLLDERDRIAADLHDHTIQHVYALGLSLGAISSGRPELSPVVDPLIDRVDAIIRELRGVIFNIRTRLSGARLTDQLQQLIDESGRMLGFEPEATFAAGVDDLDAEVGADLLAALREALSNVARHAHASRVSVTIDVTGEAVVLQVADNGVGFATDHRHVGDGLVNLRTRAERRGGSATVRAAPGAGTALTWQAPLAARSSDL